MRFPVTNLDLSKCLSGIQRDPPTYDLFGKIDHEGTNCNGHYTAGCRNRKDQKWYHFDDEITDKLNWEDIVTRDAYVLFYHKNSIDQFFTQSSRMPELWPHILSKDITVNNTENDEPKSPGSMNTTNFPVMTFEQSSFTTLEATSQFSHPY